MSEKKVCAIVVTFNRKQLLLECLSGLLKQSRSISRIVLIDNQSTDGTPLLLKESGYIIDHQSIVSSKLILASNKNSIQLDYKRLPVNSGGAGGFSEGMKLALEGEGDFFWIMDDDAEPNINSLELLLDGDEDDVVALACSVVDTQNQFCLLHRGRFDFKEIYPTVQKPIEEEFYKEKSIEIHAASFVGLAIKREAMIQAGFPIKEFFIHNDDMEYCIRLSRLGRILMIPESRILHKEVTKSLPKPTKTFFNKNVNMVPYQELWIRFFGLRNLIWIGRKYSTSKFVFYIRTTMNLLRNLKNAILYEDHKINRVLFLLHQTFDGLFGRFDNEKPKRILYKK